MKISPEQLNSTKHRLYQFPVCLGTTTGDEQDAMDTAIDMVATKAVVDCAPFNTADEYLARNY